MGESPTPTERALWHETAADSRYSDEYVGRIARIEWVPRLLEALEAAKKEVEAITERYAAVRHAYGQEAELRGNAEKEVERLRTLVNAFTRVEGFR